MLVLFCVKIIFGLKYVVIFFIIVWYDFKNDLFFVKVLSGMLKE